MSGPREAPGVTRDRVASLLGDGATLAEVARALGLSKSTVSWHARRLGRPVASAYSRRYDWGAVQRYYDAGHTVRECCDHFGFNRSAWTSAVTGGRLIPLLRRAPLADVLVAGRRTSRHALKQRLLDEGLKAPRCEECGIDRWLSEALPLHLHHVNGDGADNRLQNLRLLCPNCHSQTENWGGRAKVAGRRAA